MRGKLSWRVHPAILACAQRRPTDGETGRPAGGRYVVRAALMRAGFIGSWMSRAPTAS